MLTGRKALGAGLVIALVVGSAIGQAPPGRPDATRTASAPGGVAPRAVLVGLYEPMPAAAPGAVDFVCGKVYLDASASRSDRPIRWKWSGPFLILITSPGGDGPANSTAYALLSAPGTYRFQVVASGVTEGERDADAAAFTFFLPGGPSPQPTPQPVKPQPTPAPQPQPPRPFPSTALPSAASGGRHA